MKRLLLCLVPWMVAIAAASESPTVEVAYSHVAPIRNAVRVGNECFVDADTVAPWGWTISITGNLADVQAEGQRFKIPTRYLNGKKHVSMNVALRHLNAKGQWNGDVYEVLGAVTEIEALDGRIVVESTLAGKPKVFNVKNPGRLVLDLHGVSMNEKTKVNLGPGAKAAQYKPNILRVVIPNEDLQAAHYRPNPTRRFDYDLAETQKPTGSVAPDQTDDEGPVIVTPPRNEPQKNQQGTSAAPAKTTATSSEPDLLESTASRLTIRIPFSASLSGAANVRRVDPNTFAVWLPGAAFAGNESQPLKTKDVESWSVVQEPNGAVYTFKLSRPMGVEASTVGREFKLVLIKPDVGNGKLAGKTIVVDAGHGGHDGGAQAKDAQEKQLALSISKLLAQKLAAQGATVIMTRNSDVFVPLKERSEIANRANADLFLSVHINSSGSPEKTSGSITFFHKQSTLGKLLAECVQGEMSKVPGVPGIGVWSDTRIYKTSGFAVLRYSKMPAILIEVGFINHSRDRAAMKKADYQQKLADAIVRGVRVYLGDVKTEKEDETP